MQIGPGNLWKVMPERWDSATAPIFNSADSRLLCACVRRSAIDLRLSRAKFLMQGCNNFLLKNQKFSCGTMRNGGLRVVGGGG